jgi:hypothetical protein
MELPGAVRGEWMQERQEKQEGEEMRYYPQCRIS